MIMRSMYYCLHGSKQREASGFLTDVSGKRGIKKGATKDDKHNILKIKV